MKNRYSRRCYSSPVLLSQTRSPSRSCKLYVRTCTYSVRTCTYLYKEYGHWGAAAEVHAPGPLRRQAKRAEILPNLRGYGRWGAAATRVVQRAARRATMQPSPARVTQWGSGLGPACVWSSPVSVHAGVRCLLRVCASSWCVPWLNTARDSTRLTKNS